jgi:hypothetical protein
MIVGRTCAYPECGEVFVPPRVTTKYCPEHRGKHAGRDAQRAKRQRGSSACPDCGAPVPAYTPCACAMSGVSSPELSEANWPREAPALPELLEAMSELRPERAAAILSRAVPAPLSPPPQSGASPTPRFASWADFITQTTPAERRAWCARKAKKANGPRLMSGSPSEKVSADRVWQVLVAARGRCAHRGSLAVENRPSRPDGAPVPWDTVGRRIGSLGHRISRFNGGGNTRENLVWSCLWCNTWLGERRLGATDHGGYFPIPTQNSQCTAIPATPLE